jgi:hypothetical protein
MLKEITFYADFVKKRWCDNNKKTQNLRTFFFGTQKKKKTVIAYMRICVMLEEITALWTTSTTTSYRYNDGIMTRRCSLPATKDQQHPSKSSSFV